MTKKKISYRTTTSAKVDLKLATEYITKLKLWKHSARKCPMKLSTFTAEDKGAIEEKVTDLIFNQTVFRGINYS